MMWFNFALNGTVLIAYCVLNAAFLAIIWHMLGVGISFERSFKDVFIKTALSIIIVYVLVLLIARTFCWTALITQCLACICPVTAGISVKHVSISGMLFFLLAMIFAQLTLISIPVRLSRLLFLVTVLVSNVLIGLLKVGVSAVLM